MTTKHTLATAVTWLVAFLIIPLPLILVLNQGLIDTQINILAIDLGLCAYSWWLTIVYLSTRPRWLERYIGLPSMYFLHGILGVFALVAAFLHKNTLFSMHTVIRTTGDIAFYLEIFLLLYASVFLSGWLVDRFSFMRKLKENTKAVFTHQVSIWLHRLNLVVIALIFLHVNLIPRINRLHGFILLFDLYTLVALASYIYKKLVSDHDEHYGIISRLTRLNGHIISLAVKPNERQRKYEAGDYYFLTIVNNRAVGKEAHPFSVASAPKESKDLLFQIDQRGDYTYRLDQLKVGDLVRLEGPFGLFDKEMKDSGGPVVLYALGSGIAPLFGMAQEYDQKKKIHLIWSQAGITGPDYERILQKLEKKGVRITRQQHHFTKQQLISELSTQEIRNGRFFVVGSGATVLNVEDNLAKIGVKDKQIFDERMTL